MNFESFFKLASVQLKVLLRTHVVRQFKCKGILLNRHKASTIEMEPTMKPPIHKNRTTTMGQISGFLSKDNLFKKINLYNKIYEDSRDLTRLTRFGVPQPIPPEPIHGSWLSWPFSRVVQEEFVPAEIGQEFGPTWQTHWFKLEFTVPPEWAGKDVHIRWVTGSESTVYSEDGTLLQGINPNFREEFPLPSGTTTATYYIEMACNHIMGAGPDYKNGWGDEITPPSPNLYFKLTVADIALFREDVFQLYTDLEMLYGIANHLGNTHIGYQAMFVANQMVNDIRVDNYENARALAADFFSQGTGKKAHQLFAMGNCHIDTAWLWPYSETIRKCARSFSAQLQLLKQYPDFKFVCSQAIQLAWIKREYPGLYDEIKEAVSNGGFIPVGGTWVEMDGNVPSGEAFMRQYFYGQQFFRQEFSVICKEFWLPDTFGYSAQIPQMLKHVGIDRFLTQKMSWSLVNKFPNHSFIWEGIDGSQVTCHFPPGDSYGMSGSVEEILKSQNNSEDKGRCNNGIYLFGHGDGGGGPTRTTIERLKRVQNVDGLPNVRFSNPNEFFENLETEKHKFYKWVGELYLELHNGTYTTQAKIKWYNRKSEIFLREVEELMSIAYVLEKVDDTQLGLDMEVVDNAWKDVLLNQFHDVLPGSCIQLVAEEAWRIYERVFQSLQILRDAYHVRILEEGSSSKVIYNPLPWPVRSVIFMKPDNDDDLPSGEFIQAVTLYSSPFENQTEGRYRVPNIFAAALVNLEASGYSTFQPIEPENKVTYAANTPSPGVGTFSNGIISLQASTIATGLPTEKLFFNGSEPAFDDYLNQGVEPGRFYIYEDLPMIWDAWDILDYHLESRKEPNFSNISLQLIDVGDIVGCYRWTADFGNGSSIIRYTIMRADSPMIEYYTIVDWKEEHKLLKVEFPINVLTRKATFEIQYGHLSRPTHINTSWDMAKFEVAGHKWMDMSQADKGVTIISDSKYGWHVRDNVVSLSLLRAPKNPDANCDQHKHFIYYAALPHTGSFQEADVIRRAYELNYLGANNVPLIATDLTGAELPNNWVTVSDKAVIVAALKVAHEIPKALCVRLYESFGGAANPTITMGFAVAKVEECNGLEGKLGDIPHTGNGFTVDFKPFHIRSFLVYF